MLNARGSSHQRFRGGRVELVLGTIQGHIFDYP
jgi:hypothetical protein